MVFDTCLIFVTLRQTIGSLRLQRDIHSGRRTSLFRLFMHDSNLTNHLFRQGSSIVITNEFGEWPIISHRCFPLFVCSSLLGFSTSTTSNKFHRRLILLLGIILIVSNQVCRSLTYLTYVTANQTTRFFVCVIHLAPSPHPFMLIDLFSFSGMAVSTICFFRSSKRKWLPKYSTVSVSP